jgi:hypothetical protein
VFRTSNVVRLSRLVPSVPHIPSSSKGGQNSKSVRKKTEEEILAELEWGGFGITYELALLL